MRRADDPANIAPMMEAHAREKAAYVRGHLVHNNKLKSFSWRAEVWKELERDAYVLNGDLNNPVEIEHER